MTPWEVIEQALARRKPPQSQEWLAKNLGVGPQAVTNWKLRGRVPPAQYRAIATLLNLTVNQVEGIDPPPWDKEESGWPFANISHHRFTQLEEWQRLEIQGKVREMIEKFEAERTAGSGKSPASLRAAQKSAQQ
jgi:hypothetical protein